MPGDYSRKTFVPVKHYSGVLMQQGRVQLDADWNEQLDIARHLAGLEAVDVIGLCGVPKASDGFRVTASADNRDLLISAGRAYAGGVLAEWDSSAVAVTIAAATSTLTPETLIIDRRPVTAGQWVRLSAPSVASPRTARIASVDTTAGTIRLEGTMPEFSGVTAGSMERLPSYLTQPDLPNPTPALAPGNYVVYLEVWQREITALDDPEIREKALGGPDTAVRRKTIAQVKLLPVAAGQAVPLCTDTFAEWTALTTPPSGRMNARTQQTLSSSPCELPPTAGFTRLENQLYRVEVHRGGTRATASFKWSRDNGTVETAIEKIDGANITVSDLGKDDVLGFGNGHWVELLDPETELKGTPRNLTRITGINVAARVITLDSPVASPATKLRRWDQSGPTATSGGVAMPAGFVELENGVQVLFGEGSYRAGDYWLIPARTATGDIEWPGGAQSPAGTHRHFCRIATLRISADNQITLQDCRRVFPPLTELPGLDSGMRVTGVFGVNATGARVPLVNDSDVTSAQISGGIDVELDAPVAAESVTRPTAYVTLSRPLDPATAPPAYDEVTLASRLTVATNRIEWRLTNAGRALVDALGTPPEGDRGFLTRLTLKGHKIWSRDNPDLFLDGDAFGLRPPNTVGTRLRLPSGDSRAGGDFETWFWLRRATAPPFVGVVTALSSTIRQSGLAELTGDILITLTGGTPTAAGVAVPKATIVLNTSMPLSSPLSGNFTDAVLLIDEPTALNTSGTFNPTLPVNGVGGAGLRYDLGQAPNLFQGARQNANAVVFPGVPLDPPSAGAQRVLRIKNVRVAPTGGTAPNSQVFAIVSMQGAQGIPPLSNPTVSVAFVQDEVSTLVRLPTGQTGPFVFNGVTPLNPQMLDNPTPTTQVNLTFQLEFTEGFASAFKVRKLGPTGLALVQPGQETGWDNVGPGAIPFVQGVPVIPPIGSASSGTLLQAQFVNVPVGIRLFVTVRDLPLAAAATPPRASLTGSGPQTGVANGIALREISIVGGVGVASWEWQDANSAVTIAQVQFGIVLASAAQAPGPNPVSQQANVVAGLAPVGGDTQSGPVPRFTQRRTVVPAFIRQIARTQLGGAIGGVGGIGGAGGGGVIIR